VLPDADIFPSGVRSLAAVAESADNRADTLGAQGGAGTGDPLAAGVLLSGQGGADSLTGGDGPDLLAGGDGNDHLSGGGGDDSFDFGSGGDDVIDGGPGTDTVSYLDHGTPVSVDLAIAGPQPTGAGNDTLANIENLIGTRGADVLLGDGGPNLLLGNEGRDTLDGRGGQDVLDGGQDADSLDLRDGGPDLAECGEGADTATADLPGVDRLFNCETVVFPPANGGSGKVTTAASENTGAAHADRRAPSFLGPVKADPTRFEVARKGDRARVLAAGAGGTTFRYSLSEAATVTFTIERRTSGRKVKGRCRTKTRSNARRPRCARFRRIGSFDARAAAGTNGTPFSGRIKGRPLRPGAHRALLDAVDAAGNRSTRATASFTVLRPKRRGRAG
jgi:RTX calcium-binding nonapeptide repeat (4 copies)